MLESIVIQNPSRGGDRELSLIVGQVLGFTIAPLDEDARHSALISGLITQDATSVLEYSRWPTVGHGM